MRTSVLTLAMMTLSAGLVLAQQPPPASAATKKPTAASSSSMAKGSAALDDKLIANENAILDAIAKHDTAAFKALVAPDAWSAGSDGFMKASDFIPMMAQMTMTDWKVNDPHVMHVDANTAIVTYMWTGTASMQGQPTSDKPTYAASVWTNKGGKWMVVYHQETESAPKK